MQYDATTFTGLAGEALEQFRLVKLSSGELVYADSTDTGVIGVTQKACADAERVSVKTILGNGTQLGVAAGTFSDSAALYLANDGKIDDSGTIIIGYALKAATTAGDVVPYIVSPWPELMLKADA